MYFYICIIFLSYSNPIHSNWFIHNKNNECSAILKIALGIENNQSEIESIKQYDQFLYLQSYAMSFKAVISTVKKHTMWSIKISFQST